MDSARQGLARLGAAWRGKEKQMTDWADEMAHQVVGDVLDETALRKLLKP